MAVEESIPFVALDEKIKQYRDENVVPIFLDQSEEDKVNTFLAYQNSIIIEGKKLVMDKVSVVSVFIGSYCVILCL